MVRPDRRSGSVFGRKVDLVDATAAKNPHFLGMIRPDGLYCMLPEAQKLLVDMANAADSIRQFADGHEFSDLQRTICSGQVSIGNLSSLAKH